MLINLGKQVMLTDKLSIALFSGKRFSGKKFSERTQIAIHHQRHFALYSIPSKEIVALPPVPQLAADQALFQYQQFRDKHQLSCCTVLGVSGC